MSKYLKNSFNIRTKINVVERFWQGGIVGSFSGEKVKKKKNSLILKKIVSWFIISCIIFPILEHFVLVYGHASQIQTLFGQEFCGGM